MTALVKYLPFVFALAAAAPVPAQVPSSPPKAKRMEPFVYGYASAARDFPADRIRPVRAVGDPDAWITVEDYPADLQAKGLGGSVDLLVTVNPESGVQDCVVEKSYRAPDFAELACPIIRKRARFHPALSISGQPMAGTISVSLGWQMRDPDALLPPAPSPPPPTTRGLVGNWPKATYWANVVGFASNAPDWKKLRPKKARPPQGSTTGVRLSVDPQGNARSCQVRQGSGDPGLDEVACAGLKSAIFDVHASDRGLSAKAPPFDVDLLVKWVGKTGTTVFPEDRLVRPPELTDFGGFSEADRPGGPLPQYTTLRLRISVDASGRGSACHLYGTSGADAWDTRACQLAVERLGFTPGVNAFGVPAGGRVDILFNWAALKARWDDDYSAKPEELARSCAAGNPQHCTSYGNTFRYDRSNPAARDAAMTDAFQKGCDGGDPVACTSLATHLVNIDPKAINRDQTIALHRKGCEGNALYGRSLNACGELALNLREGRYVSKDVAAATALFAMLCAERKWFACHAMAQAYDKGEGIAADPVKATAHYDLACKHYIAGSCADYHTRLAAGLGIKADPVKALAWSRRECSHTYVQDAGACLFAGRALLAGKGAPVDRAAAQQYFLQGCASKNMDSCREWDKMRGR